MELNAALEVFGLAEDATPADLETTYRGLRKPLLKELNKHDEGEEPPELIERLDTIETAFKVLTASVPRIEPSAQPAPEAQGEAPQPPPDAPTAGDVSASQTGAAGTGATQGQTQGASSEATGRAAGRVAFVEGDVLLERYEVRSRVSVRPEGDMYRAFDRVRRASVHLKVLHPELVAERKQRAHLKRSLLSVSFLNHPHVARVLGVLELPRTYAVVYQLPEDCENLWDLMYGEGASKDRLGTDAVLGLTGQAAHALAYVHTLMPHATLRPESIWLDAQGNIKIADVGFADVQRQLRDRRQSRTKLGTAYWAPEQYRNDAAVGERSDQYALALIVYEILSGKPSVGRTEKIRGFRKDYPQRFTQALERALSSKADRRFESLDAFGDAALSHYAPERAAPAAVSRESLFVPALVLLALFAGFVLSPLGRGVGDEIARAVRRWHSVEERAAGADLELRQLRGMTRRLAARGDALDEASQAELQRVREKLADPKTPEAERPALRTALTSVLGQLISNSRRRAQDALEARVKTIDALEGRGRAKVAKALEGVREAVPGLDAPSEETRVQALTQVVRQHAAAERGDVLWRSQLARVLAAPVFSLAYGKLLEAESALGIGDEAAAERAYEDAAAALESAESVVTEAMAAVEAFDPLSRPAGIAEKLVGDAAAPCFDVLVEPADALTDDADLARVLDAARGTAKRKARAHSLVHDDGYWTLAVDLGARTVWFAGTWSGTGTERTLTLRIAADRLLPKPFTAGAQLGAERPSVGDLCALLGAAPRDERALWSVRGADDAELPRPLFQSSGMIVRAGKRAVAGTLKAEEGLAVLVEGRRFDVGESGFDASATISGDVLVTWLRAHALAGMQTGPGALLRVQVDGLAPRVHVLEPAAGAKLEPGTDVTVRVLVYDSTLTTLEVGGEAQALRRDEVYTLIEKLLRVPARGKLTMPVVRAADAAGNLTVSELSWDVR